MMIDYSDSLLFNIFNKVNLTSSLLLSLIKNLNTIITDRDCEMLSLSFSNFHEQFILHSLNKPFEVWIFEVYSQIICKAVSPVRLKVI